MVNQAWDEEGKIVIACVQRDAKIRGIKGKNTIFLKELIEFTKKAFLN